MQNISCVNLYCTWSVILETFVYFLNGQSWNGIKLHFTWVSFRYISFGTAVAIFQWVLVQAENLDRNKYIFKGFKPLLKLLHRVFRNYNYCFVFNFFFVKFASERYLRFLFYFAQYFYYYFFFGQLYEYLCNG